MCNVAERLAGPARLVSLVLSFQICVLNEQQA
jgi:hypothetical protein